MPKIATYQLNQVATQVISQPRAQDAPAAAFGAPIAKGIAEIARAGFEIKQRIDITSAEEALVNFEREKNNVFFNPDNGYFNTQGKDAYDRSTDATKSLDKLKQQFGENLSQQARMLFDKSAAKHISSAQADIARHASKGLKAWEISTIEAQVENSVENASLYWDNPERLSVQNVLGRQAILDSADMLGLSPEATAEKIQTFESTFARSTIEAATQASSIEGKSALEKYGSRLEGPDKVKMQKIIEAKEKVEKTESDARAAVLTATKLIDQFDDRNEIMDEVNKIEDVDLRKKTMSEAMSQYSRKKQAETETRAAVFEDAEKFIMEGGTAEAFKMQNPEQWELMSPKQQRSIESGTPVGTDWKVFSDLMLLPKEKLAKVDPTEYFNKLGKSERSKLISAVRAAGGRGSSKDKVDSQAGRSRAAQTTSAAEQVFGKKSKWTGKKLDQVNAFYAVLDGEVDFRETEKGSKLTSEEYTNLLAGLTRKVVIEKDWWPDAELDLTDVPAEDVPVLSKFLRDNNIPVTADNLIKAYQQASQ